MSDEWAAEYAQREGPSAEELDHYTRANRDRMRRALATPEGRTVLSFLLDTLGLFRPAVDDTDRVLRNYAIFFMSHGLGVLFPENHDRIVDALLAVPPHESGPRD